MLGQIYATIFCLSHSTQAVNPWFHEPMKEMGFACSCSEMISLDLIFPPAWTGWWAWLLDYRAVNWRTGRQVTSGADWITLHVKDIVRQNNANSPVRNENRSWSMTRVLHMTRFCWRLNHCLYPWSLSFFPVVPLLKGASHLWNAPHQFSSVTSLTGIIPPISNPHTPVGHHSFLFNGIGSCKVEAGEKCRGYYWKFLTSAQRIKRLKRVSYAIHVCYVDVILCALYLLK